MSFLDNQTPLIPLVPEEIPHDKDKTGIFKVYSTPGETDTTRYDFVIHHIDGTEGVSAIFEFIRRAEKLRIAAAHNNVNVMEPFHGIVTTLLHVPAKTGYEEGVAAAVGARHKQLRIDAYQASIQTAVNPAQPTQVEIDAAEAASEAVDYPTHITLDEVRAGFNNMVTLLVPTGALSRVKRYLRRGCRKPADMKIRTYVSHLNRINTQDLPMFPPFDTANSMSEEEIREIIQYAIPNSWNRKLREQSKDPLTMTLANLITTLENYESAESDFDPASKTKKPTTKNKNGSKGKAKASSKTADSDGDGEFYCMKHGKNSTHDTNACKVLKNLIKSEGKPSVNKKSTNKTWKRDKSTDKKVKKEESNLASIVKKAVKAEMKSVKKRDLHAMDITSADDDDIDMSGIDFEELEGMSAGDLNDEDSVKSKDDN